ncbi:MAG: hypothetical protein IJJ33_06300, partial [Victivallales bacterium]|nr:hypothetical protein [Victivallales bacterium]
MRFPRSSCLGFLLTCCVTLWAMPPCEVAERGRNLLPNACFTELVPAAAFSLENISVQSAMPAGWNIDIAPDASRKDGSVSVKQNEWGNELNLDFPHNTANAVKILSPAIPAKSTVNGLFCGFWARGRGTVTVELAGAAAENGVTLPLDSFAIVPEWHFYRTSKVSTWKEGRSARLSFAPYG